MGVVVRPRHDGERRIQLASKRISRTARGVEELTTLMLGHGADPDPAEYAPRELHDSLRILAELLATEHGLVTLLAQQSPGRADLTVPSHHQGAPTPLAFALGPQESAETGLRHAQNPPHPLDCPHLLGDPARPALHYALPNGSPAAAWQQLEALLDHLQSPAGPAAPGDPARRAASG